MKSLGPTNKLLKENLRETHGNAGLDNEYTIEHPCTCLEEIWKPNSSVHRISNLFSGPFTYASKTFKFSFLLLWLSWQLLCVFSHLSCIWYVINTNVRKRNQIKGHFKNWESCVWIKYVLKILINLTKANLTLIVYVRLHIIIFDINLHNQRKQCKYCTYKR